MYVDADVLYAHLKPTDWLKKYAEHILALPNLTTSIITVIELELIARRDFDEPFAHSILSRLKKLKNLTFIDLNETITSEASTLRKKYGLNIFDALHLSTAISAKEQIIVSSDHMFDTVRELERKDPRTF